MGLRSGCGDKGVRYCGSVSLSIDGRDGRLQGKEFPQFADLANTKVTIESSILIRVHEADSSGRQEAQYSQYSLLRMLRIVPARTMLAVKVCSYLIADRLTNSSH